MITWEYKVVGGYRDASNVESKCNSLGADGWEMVAATPVLELFDNGGFGESREDSKWHMIFKRPAS